jgi:D-alanyl-lipoteichoic acid acyltransferase DltB (MBOAT superfamily)
VLFNSELFIFVFLPVTLIGYFLIGSRGWRRPAIAWLVLASIVFYGWLRWDYLLLLLILILFNYYYGIRLARDYHRGRPNPVALTIGLAVNLMVLAYFKYTNFLLDNINLFTGTKFNPLEIVLPLGISFFIFQKIAYLVDAYRGEAEEYDFIDFSLFVMYFPQLIAGPIVHHKEMIPQFRNPAILRVSAIDLAVGLTLFSIGIVKKVVIADTLVHWSDPTFAAAGAGGAPSLIEAWVGALAFTFQIYFDFSGYTDMALGLALMIGVRLPANFNSPYKATNIIDFWRCWHITLSRFLRDYVYIPLGGNRLGRTRRYVNLMATMLLGGLWHGASWTFVAWGGLHGLYLMVNHGWRALQARRGVVRRENAVRGWACRSLTFLAVVVAWVFFRATSFQAALAMLDGMIGLNGIALPAAYEAKLGDLAPYLRQMGVGFDLSLPSAWGAGWMVLVLSALLVIVWAMPNSLQLLAPFRPALSAPEPLRLPVSLRRLAMRLRLVAVNGSFVFNGASGLLIGILLFSSLLFQSVRSTTLHPFIYFQF